LVSRLKGIAIGAIIIVAAAILLLWYGPTIISYFQNSSYTKLTIVNGQVGKSVQFGESIYTFSYVVATNPLTNQTISRSIIMATPSSGKIYEATQGATYKDLGIEVKVSEVHEDYAIILVKSTIG
jgi:hypothetical protein